MMKEARYTEKYCLEMLALWETACAILPGQSGWVFVQTEYWTKHLTEAVAYREKDDG